MASIVLTVQVEDVENDVLDDVEGAIYQVLKEKSQGLSWRFGRVVDVTEDSREEDEEEEEEKD